jgi:hypothetical protein
MASDNATAANRLVRDRLARPGVTRAYFAAYCAVTARLHAQGLNQFGEQSNPPHRIVPDLINDNLAGLRVNQRQQLGRAVRRLYKRRIVADYQPRYTVDDRTGHEALRDMNLVREILGAS